MASNPDATGPGAHTRLTPPPSSWKSTTTVTPLVFGQAPACRATGVATGSYQRDEQGDRGLSDHDTAITTK